MPKLSRSLTALAIAISLSGIWYFTNSKPSNSWAPAEINILRSLWIGNLPPLPADNSNAIADNIEAAEFGYQLFFDKRFSKGARVSCANCHQPEVYFTDGLRVAIGIKPGIRNSMSIVGIAYSPWLFWDGRKDSLWSQALSPLENSLEHAGSRMQFAHVISQDENYRSKYESLFGPLPNFTDASRFPAAAGPVDNKKWGDAWRSMRPEDRDMVTDVFVNLGKSIAAYERLLLPGVSRFDSYVEGVLKNDSEKKEVLSLEEIAGLRLFIGKAQCINCHNGPLLTNNEFHNTSILPSSGKVPSIGRVSGIRILQTDIFNCLGSFSDAVNKECAELRFVRTGDELIGTHKVPSLRNVSETGPYMHAGQLETLAEVISHYNRAPGALIGHNETKPLNLSIMEMRQLEVFLRSLAAPLATDLKWLARP